MDENPKRESPSETDISDLISLGEASQFCGLSQDHLRRLAGQGDLWAKKIGRNWVTTRKAVQNYIDTANKPGWPKSS